MSKLDSQKVTERLKKEVSKYNLDIYDLRANVSNHKYPSIYIEMETEKAYGDSWDLYETFNLVYNKSRNAYDCKISRRSSRDWGDPDPGHEYNVNGDSNESKILRVLIAELAKIYKATQHVAPKNIEVEIYTEFD